MTDRVQFYRDEFSELGTTLVTVDARSTGGTVLMINPANVAFWNVSDNDKVLHVGNRACPENVPYTASLGPLDSVELQQTLRYLELHVFKCAPSTVPTPVPRATWSIGVDKNSLMIAHNGQTMCVPIDAIRYWSLKQTGVPDRSVFTVLCPRKDTRLVVRGTPYEELLTRLMAILGPKKYARL